jgi:putative phosphoesterase
MQAKPLQRIGALGDIHTEDERLDTALQFLKQSSLDAIVAVGDVVDGPGDLNRCCSLLQEAGVLTVRGNHERWFLNRSMRRLPEATPEHTVSKEARSFLEGLPRSIALTTIAGKLLLCHGLGEDDMELVKPHDSDEVVEVNEALQGIIRRQEFSFLLNGHSHERMVRTIGSLTLINAGTLHRKYEPCFFIADFARQSVEFYNLPKTSSIKAAEVFSMKAPNLQISKKSFTP